MSAKQEQLMISNEAKKTRDQPNLTECQSCGLRTPSHKRLEILYSEWRIILLCTKCFNLVESSKICSYCFRKFSAKAKSFRCCQCKRVVHKSCFANRKNVAPWSYSCHDDSGGGFSVCVDCWVPKSVAIKRGKVCGVSKRNNTGVLGRSLEDVVEDAACTVQEKVEAAVRARELVVRMALKARKAADVARKTLDLVANNGGGKESNDNADDFELAFRLHRAMNNSPRVSSNLCLVNSSCSGVPMIGEDNGEMRTRNSELGNLGAFEKLDGFMNQIVEVGRLKSNGNDDGIIRPDAKKDGSVAMQMKQRKQSFFNKLINSRGDDRSVSSDSQSYREGKHDRYLLKYSRKRVLFKYSRSKVLLKYCRRKIDERLIPNGRPKFLYEGLLSRVGLPQQKTAKQSSEASPAGDSSTSSLQIPPDLSSSLATSSSIASDYGSDIAYETSDLGTPRLERGGNFGIGLGDLAVDEDLTSPIEKLVKYGMMNIDEGLFMGHTILEQLEGFPRHTPHGGHINNVIGKDGYNGNASKASFLTGNGMEVFSEPEPGKVFGHVRKLSCESVESDGSSLRGSEISNSGIPNSSGNGSLDLPGVAEISSSTEVLGNTELQFSGDAHIVLPLDQRHKMNRVLLTMQRRLVTAKTDMEDLVSRLNQEIAVKDYLTTKVKDLEGEFETAKQKNKETMQQAILIERERLTQMQWDMEELRRKSLEMELKLKSKEGEQRSTEFQMAPADHEKDIALEELDATRKQQEELSRRYEELEAKSKADIKFLAKEFKSLKSSQATLKQELSQSLKEKSDIVKLLYEERETKEHEKTTRKKLLHDCRILYDQLQGCNGNLSSEDNFIVNSSLGDALDFLTTSDDQIYHLLAEAQLLFEDDKITAPSKDTRATDDELRKILANILTDNAKLRKQVNAIMRHALKMGSICGSSNDEAPSSNNHDVER